MQEKVNKIENNNYEFEKIHLGSLDQIYKNFNFDGVRDNGKKIIEIFENNNLKLLIAGGFVRDVLLNKLPKDIDFVTDKNYENIERILKDNLLDSEIKYIDSTGKIFQVMRIIFTNGEEYEIATFRKDGEYKDGIHPENVETTEEPKQDAQRRDFTINALFYDPKSGDVIDYVGGLEDLKNKKLRFVGDPEKRINEDKSRIIRYVRLLLQTGFNGDKFSEEAIINNVDKINIVPRELLKKELDKIIQTSNIKEFIEILDKLNLLEKIFPDIKELKNCAGGPPHHMEGNTLIHTLMVCENLKIDADSILKWSALFHDIGKIETRKSEIKDGKQKISFINHDKIGAEKVSKILRRLKFTITETKDIAWLVENHLRIFMQIHDLIKNNEPQKAKEKITKLIKKLIKNSSEKQVLRLINLAQADNISSIFEDETEKYINFDFVLECFGEAKNEIQTENKNDIYIEKIVSGRIIMEELQLSSGTRIGEIKKQIIDELSDQNFYNKEDAKEEFLKILKRLKNQNIFL
ncbi:MAG: CCA tRNA nucleotidyltransferase [Patescibacteria group bacterium]|nr:CCA tRNA nucleotidyltransferase [Patescibacteria group bacterium]